MSAKVHDSSMESDDRESKGSTRRPKIPFMFILLVMLCMSMIFSNFIAYSFTVTQFHSYGNGSAADFYSVYDYRQTDEYDPIINITLQRRKFLSNPQKELLIMVGPIGAILAVFPTTMAYHKWGFSRTITVCGLMSVVFSMLIPLTANAPLFALAIIIRVCQGFSFGAFLPVIAKVGSYLSIEDFTFTTVFLFSYMQMAATVVFPVAGLLCASSLGWHSVHYTFATLTTIIYIIFLLYHSSSSFQRTVRQSRLFEVFYGTVAEHRSSSILTFHLPYLSIYQDLSIWAIFIAAFGYFSAQQLTIQYAPLFLSKVALFDTVSTGFLSAVPTLIGLLLSFTMSIVHPHITLLNISTVNRIRLLNSLSAIVPGLFFVCLSLIDPAESPKAATALFIIGSSLLGLSAGGFFASIRQRAAHFSVFIVANLHVVTYVAMFFISLLNVLISKNEEYNLDEWKPLFVGHGIFLLVCNSLFCVFVNIDQAEWSKEGYQDTSYNPERADPLPQRPL